MSELNEKDISWPDGGMVASNPQPSRQVEYKYISFVESITNKNKQVWQCVNNSSKEELGLVKWYATWRRYCYFPTVQAVYSDDCLDDISHFIKQIAS